MRQILGTFAFLSVVSLQAQISVVGALDNNKILIGDQAVLHLEAKYPENYKVINIDFSALDSIFAEKDTQNPDPDPGQLEIISLENWDTLIHNGLVTLSSDIKLTAWKPGVYYIPPIIFRFQENKKLTQSKATNRLALLVDYPITDQTAADSIQLAPIKDIIAEPLKFQDFLPYIIGFVVLVGGIFLGIFLYKRFSKKEEFEKIKVRKNAAHEVAIEKLKLLKGANLWQQGMIKEYQSELSHTIREYVENRYEILALESTTDEILSDLKEKDFDDDLKGNLKEMLQLADLVKFAKAEPPVERHQQLMQFAEDFVLKTKKEISEEEAYEEITVKRSEKRASESAISSSVTESTVALPQMQLAGFWQRFLAHVIDINLFTISFFVVTFILAMIINLDDPSVMAGVIIFIVITFCYILYGVYYYAYMESKRGYTIGKKFMGIQVVDYNGDNIKMSSAIIRLIIKLISLGFFFIPCITFFFTKKKQVPHDMVAKTLVTKRVKQEQMTEILDV